MPKGDLTTASDLQRLEARIRALRLAADLYRQGLTTRTLPLARSIPSLSAGLREEFSDDEAAADHYSLFGLEVFPFASFFLGGGADGGPSAYDFAADFSARLSDQKTGGEPPDHISSELRLLSRLLAIERETGSGATTGSVKEVRALQLQLLDQHLLWWVPAFVFAVRSEDEPFYASLADLTLSLLLDLRETFVEEMSGNSPVPRAGRNILEEEGTGLREIGRFLARPSDSGLYLSWSTISHIANSSDIPGSFGSREKSLEALLRTGADLDRLEHLLTRLSSTVDLHVSFFTQLRTVKDGLLAKVADTWLAKLKMTETLLRRMRVETESGHGESG